MLQGKRLKHENSLGGIHLELLKNKRISLGLRLKN